MPLKHTNETPDLGLFHVWQSGDGTKRRVCVPPLKSKSEMCSFMARCTREKIFLDAARDSELKKRFNSISVQTKTCQRLADLISVKRCYFRTSAQSRVHKASLPSGRKNLLSTCGAAKMSSCLPQLTSIFEKLLHRTDNCNFELTSVVPGIFFLSR